MTIPASGPVDFFKLKTEYKPSTSNTSISMNELYSGGSYVKGGGYLGIPTSGTIGVNNLLGTYDRVFTVGHETMTSGNYTTLTGSQGFTYIRDIKTDKFGNVYVAGTYLDTVVVGGTQNNYEQIKKYDTSGNLLWSKTISSSISSYNGITIDNINSCFYTIGSTNAGPYQDASIQKYDLDGNIIWTRTYATTSYATEHGYGAIGLDSSGNVYAAWDAPYGSVNKSSIILKKLNSSGTEQFSRVFIPTQSTGSLNNLYINSLRVSPSGNVYVSAHSDLQYQGQVVVIKWNSSGTLQWYNKYYNTAYAQLGAQGGFAIDSAENVYVSFSSNTANESFVMIKINSSGTLQWGNRYQYSGFTGVNYNQYGGGFLAVDSSDNVHSCYIADFTVTTNTNLNYIALGYTRVSSAGTPSWATVYRQDAVYNQTTVSGVATLNPVISLDKETNNMYLGGAVWNPTSFDGYGGQYGHGMLSWLKLPTGTAPPTGSFSNSLLGGGALVGVTGTVAAVAITFNSGTYAPNVGSPAETAWTAGSSNTTNPTFVAKTQYDRVKTKL